MPSLAFKERGREYTVNTYTVVLQSRAVVFCVEFLVLD